MGGYRFQGLDPILESYRHEKWALIPLLQQVQEALAGEGADDVGEVARPGHELAHQERAPGRLAPGVDAHDPRVVEPGGQLHFWTDVEEYFHPTALAPHFSPDRWDGLERRSPEVMDRLMGFAQEEEMARRFVHALGSPNYFSNDSMCYNGRYFGYRLVEGSWPVPEYDSSQCIVLWGANPPHAHPNMTQMIMRGRKAGAKLVVVDPRMSAIARQADLHAAHAEEAASIARRMSVPGFRPAISTALRMKVTAASLESRLGAKPPSSPTPVFSPCSRRTALSAWNTSTPIRSPRRRAPASPTARR